MKKCTIVLGFCLVLFLSAGSVFAQFMGQQIPGQIIPGQIIPGQIFPGQTVPGQVIIPGQYGFGLQTVSVVQAWSYGNKMPIVLQGTIVQFYGGKDKYIFRDSSGDVIVKIGNKEWQTLWFQGVTISTSDTIEIYGEVRWPKNSYMPEVHVKFIRKI
ncbi:MAG: NirD/YgiW/YdeI family stress tolerance protein [Treponema sp.]|nr:NirD/YgiW/YdeI family stress tolerance protein [Treponema sp.]